jgi:hypothetical protein
MWKRLWHKVPVPMRSRPISTFFTFWLLYVGIFSVFFGMDSLDDVDQIQSIVSMWISVYLIVASLVIIVSTFANDIKWRSFHFFGQVYGWLFIASASAALTLTYLATMPETSHAAVVHWFWAWTWLIICIAAVFKSVHYLTSTKEHMDE